MNEDPGFALTREQVRCVYALAIDELGYPGVVLMENAGLGATDEVLDLLRQRSSTGVVIFAGPGINGGDGDRGDDDGGDGFSRTLCGESLTHPDRFP